MEYRENDEFKKEFKKLSKKYKTLEKDFTLLKEIIMNFPEGGESRHSVRLREDENKKIVKRRMMCRSTRGQNFRVIHSYNKDTVEVLFIEVYFKGDKEIENKSRIDKVWAELSD